MKRKCSDQWPDDENSRLVQDACEKANMSVNVSNVLSVTPVSTPDITYTNVYCAICNNHSVSEYVYWKPGLYCGNDSDSLNVNGNVNWKKIGQICSIAFFEQPNVTLRWLDPLRPCISENFVDECLPYNQLEKTSVALSKEEYTCTADWCKSYTEYLYESPDLTSFSNVYKNIHCAICNGANVSRLLCKRVQEIVTCHHCIHIIALLEFGDMGEISFKTGKVVRLVTETCIKQQVYDLGRMHCHDLVCAPGFQLFGDVCKQSKPNTILDFTLIIMLVANTTVEKLHDIMTAGKVDSFQYALQIEIQQFVANGTIKQLNVVLEGTRLHIQLSISMVNDSNIIQESLSALNNISLLFYYNGVLFQTSTVSPPTSISTTSTHTSSVTNLVCDQYTSLNKSEYKLFENETVLATATNRLLHQSNYTIFNGTVLHCKDSTQDITGKKNVEKKLAYETVIILSVVIGTRALLFT